MTLINELGKYVDALDIDVGSEGEGSKEGPNENPDIMKQGLSYKNSFTVDDADPKELEMGEKVEMEHTDDPKLARKIALDHLSEIPDYYTRLRKMEKDAGRDLDEFINM